MTITERWAAGLFTRPIAFLLSGEMAVAYFQFAAPMGLWPIMNNGVTPALYCFVWLYLSAAGPGSWSLDAWRAARPKSSMRRAGWFQDDDATRASRSC